MYINDLRGLTTRAAFALLLVAGAAACSLENQKQPALSGPSELGLSIAMTASPDQLPRDGATQSVVTLTARDSKGKAVAGQRLTLSMPVNSPSGTTLSATDVTTNAGGQATFTVTAPVAGSLGNITIFAVPFGTDSNNASTRTIAITALPLNGTVPVPSFIFLPNGPEVGQVVTFDASGTQDEGRSCTDACTFAWDFGTEGTATGRVVTHTFQSGGSFVVTLRVTDSANSVGTSQRTIAIGAPGPPIAAFTFSPSPAFAGQTTTFDASTSTVSANHRIVTYAWNWGDGSANTTTTASTVQHTYAQPGSPGYAVTLTVTDDRGQSANVTRAVTVTNGLTAIITQAPGNPVNVSQTVQYDGSTSTSSTGTRITNYNFDFGDGTTAQSSAAATAKHEFLATGTYTVTLTITDEKGQTALKTVQTVVQ